MQRTVWDEKVLRPTSVKRMHCDKTKESPAQIFIPYKNVYSSFLTLRMVGGDDQL